MRTQVGIVGAGPAGLLLAHLLRLRGIDSVIVEAQSRAYCENRIRAGVLEQGTVDTLIEAGLGARLQEQGLVHHGIELLFERERHRIDLTALTGGKCVTVYGQHEVVRDLIAAAVAADQPIMFESADVSLHGLDGDKPTIIFKHDGRQHELQCDYIAGCDGFHGVSRASIPEASMRTFERVYPFGWLGILAKAAPSRDELVYARHDNGFALFSMRSPDVTRLYLQCAPDEDLGKWSDERIWDELETRFESHDGWQPARGEIFQRSVAPLRSFVTEPMRYGRMFLAGDAAHIVPPTGAKGMNLAVADVRVLSAALSSFYDGGGERALDQYSERCLRRVWRAEHFSYFMTNMLHRSESDTPFMERLKLSELRYVTSSPAAAQGLAENYVGLPFDE